MGVEHCSITQATTAVKTAHIDCEAMALRVIAVHFRSTFAARRLARNFSRATGIALYRFLQPDKDEDKPFREAG